MRTLMPLLARYDGFILDQYGVLHDGSNAYPGAVSALEALSAAGKPPVLLTNSGRSADENATRLAQLGFDPSKFLAIVTSGDAAGDWVRAEVAASRLPQHVPTFVIERGGTAAERLDVTAVDRPEDAAFLLLAGSRADEIELDVYQEQIAPLARRGVPCLCTNPDIVMLTPSGLKPAAGAIARIYEAEGGVVTYLGKPHRAIYDRAKNALGITNPARICCVGDSVEHDIAGGQSAGMTTALVRTGILSEATEAGLADVYTECGVEPDHVIDWLAPV